MSTLAIVFGRQTRTLAKIPGSRRRSLQARFGQLAVALPHSRRELGWFIALSLSAGFCEEFLFRGYLIWALQPLLGLWGGSGLSVVAFALVHSYQGREGILKTGTVAILFTLVVLGCGSLWPAIALHVVLDVGSGLTAWLVLREVPGSETQ